MKYDFFKIEKRLDGYSWFFWLWFGDRNYPRNTINIRFNMTTALTFILLSLSFQFYTTWPNDGLSVLYVFLALLICILSVIESANECLIEILAFVLLGGALWLCDPKFGFEMNGYHYESTFYAVMFTGGCIAGLRRIWNAIIWRILDGIVINLNGSIQ